MNRFWGVIVIATAACAPRTNIMHQEIDTEPDERQTLLVESEGGMFAARIDGRRLGTISGRRSCLLLPLTIGRVSIEIDPTDGGPLLYTPLELLSAHKHWRMRLGIYPTRFDMLSLQPTFESCR